MPSRSFVIMWTEYPKIKKLSHVNKYTWLECVCLFFRHVVIRASCKKKKKRNKLPENISFLALMLKWALFLYRYLIFIT